ncbi:MAG TPA: tRNA uridine-5-carboxymethylaminomethyl(34) synthesis GTPase MnmE [Desulfurivibrionaceae bacterium]|nr:tRNA uridine-5-carboxymethylaminomethyl(34) synthesis GTPase MnmE [Desulfurivibrionaceae bacterium]
MATPDHSEATIAAIATPPGPGGIGVIRLSGPAARAVLETLFRPKNPLSSYRSHRLYYGQVVAPQSGLVLDEALAVFMRAPHSYTREDVVELQCHGSFLVLQEILALILTQPGVRLATPGEFTKRAFLNGRIDLTQAEAVIELLQAKSPAGAQMAADQLEGGLLRAVKTIRDNLLSVRAIMEVAIDFPDEDVEIVDAERLCEQLATGVREPLTALVARAGQGRLFRDGIAAVILGRPNVGKSSLLNSLLREERAIVTAVPGTTRDTIEEYLVIKGMPVRIIDTAGIRETAEAVEELGIRRSRQKMADADLVLLVVDGTVGVTEEDRQLLASVGEKTVVLVINKCDVAAPEAVAMARDGLAGMPAAAISAKTGAGIGELEEVIFATVAGAGQWEPGHASVPNVRHEAAMRLAIAATDRVLDGLAVPLPPDLIAVEVQAALDHLGEIIGETTTEEMLDLIFSRFCIGK